MITKWMGPNKFLSAQIMTKLEKKFSIYDNFSKKKGKQREKQTLVLSQEMCGNGVHTWRVQLYRQVAHTAQNIYAIVSMTRTLS